MFHEHGYSISCSPIKVAENTPSGTGSQYSPYPLGAFMKKQILHFVQDDKRGQDDEKGRDDERGQDDGRGRMTNEGWGGIV